MKPRALLLGQNPEGPSQLAAFLRRYGCKCWFASSYEDTCFLLSFMSFDLVLSPLTIRGGSIFQLLSILEGSRISMFFFHVVEKGCWWIPALLYGKNSFGSNALRPREFIGVLEEVIREIQAEGSALTEIRPSPSSGSREQTIMVLDEDVFPGAVP